MNYMFLFILLLTINVNGKEIALQPFDKEQMNSVMIKSEIVKSDLKSKLGIIDSNPDYLPINLYPPVKLREKSPGNTTYYVNLKNGSDKGDGLTESTAWKSFIPINNLLFSQGDQIRVIEPGAIHNSLMPMVATTASQPLVIHFAAGRYDVFREKLAKGKFHISNTNDNPDELKAIFIYLKNTKNIHIEGDKSTFFMRGKMIEVCVDHCENISFNGIHLDYQRPTVSEFTIQNITDRYADIKIHKDSTYKIINDKLTWVGEGWEHAPGGSGQRLLPKENIVRRGKCPLNKIVRFEELKPFHIRLHWKNDNPGFLNGVTYQVRQYKRDCVGILHQYSKNIVWKNSGFHFLHGMGVVSQFTENLTFRNMQMAPRKESGRTCSAWADILHFSGCRGQINVFNVFFSGANDDAINNHGTHLRIMKRVSDHQIKVRYMHHQTYGFMQYREGDQIEFIRTKYMTPYASNTIVDVKQLNNKEFLITLKEKAPTQIEGFDVIENTTWTAALHVKNCTVERIPTRGFLITTRQKVIIEDTLFWAPMVGILCEDDARGWYESGYIRDMLVKNCTFLNCGIVFSPKAKEYNEEGVHKNITITKNCFITSGKRILSARYTDNITVNDNQIITTDKKLLSSGLATLIDHAKCKQVKIENNNIKYVKEPPELFKLD